MCPTEQMKKEHAGIKLLLDILADEEFHRRWIVGGRFASYKT